MDSVIDLDQASRQIEQRRHAWAEQGFQVSDLTWRESDGWPPQIESDRASISDPDSVGVFLRHALADGDVILYRGGWADVSYGPLYGPPAPIGEAPDVTTSEEFGGVLDAFFVALCTVRTRGEAS